MLPVPLPNLGSEFFMQTQNIFRKIFSKLTVQNAVFCRIK